MTIENIEVNFLFVAPHVSAWIEIEQRTFYRILADQSHPPVGAWIEIYGGRGYGRRSYVAPPVGAWIEIN